MGRIARMGIAVACVVASSTVAHADTTNYFRACQTYTTIENGVTFDTIRSNGYVFTYTRDKLFTGGTGHVIGRAVRVPWPDGVEAQAVTTPPPGVTDYKARITLRKADGQPFDFRAFTFKLLANTAGAGGTLEIMPMLNGEDAFADPIYFDATGYAGMTFTYDTTPNPWGSTALLHGYDTYKLGLYVDFALIGLTLDSTAPGEQSCCLPGGSCADLTAGDCGLQGGTSLGPDTSCACDACAGPVAPPPAPDGSSATSPVRAARLTVAGDAIEVTWDASTCPAPDYNLLFGILNNVSAYLLSGSVCAIGTGGSAVWSSVPPGDLYFVVVGTDGAGTESSWGLDGAGQERNGPAASGECGATVKNASATCP